MRPEFGGFSHNKEKAMYIDRTPPSTEEMVQRLAARIARDGSPPHHRNHPPSPTATPARTRALPENCHLPTEPKPLHPPPRDNAAYRAGDGGARRERPQSDGRRAPLCPQVGGIRLPTRPREPHAEITVTYLMRPCENPGAPCSVISASWSALAISASRLSMPARACAPDCSSLCLHRCFRGITGMDGRRS